MSRPLRVLYVVPGGTSPSAMVFAHEEIARVAAAGHEVATFVLPPGVVRPVRLLAAWRALRRVERDHRPDLVHAHFGTLTAFLCAVACRLPVVVTFRGSDLNPSPWDGVVRNVVQKLLSQLAGLRARAIICVSAELLSRLWWGRGKAVVLPTGVDLDVFRPLPRDTARARLGWEPQDRVVLFNGGAGAAGKRLDLARAAANVASRFVNGLRLEVLDGNVPHAEMPVYLSAADCLLVTSDYEGSPDIVKEALACGLPVVSVAVGDVPERLAGVEPSSIVPRDPEAIGTAVADILAAPRRSNGRDRIAGLAAPAIRDHLLAVYRRALERR